MKAIIEDSLIESIKKRYIAIDVETTGLSKKSDRIIELGAVLFENGKVTDSFNSLVNPDMYVSPKITAITHITNEMVLNAPDETNIYSKFVKFLGNAMTGETVVCAHNASFDMGFLKETFSRLGIKYNLHWVDTVALTKHHVKGLDNRKLGTVAEHFGIINRAAHRATTDAEVCGKILWEIIQIMDAEEPELHRQLLEEDNKVKEKRRARKDSAKDITYEITENLGVLYESPTTGWLKEVNLVSWNGFKPKLDIRGWSSDHGRKGSGITLNEREARKLYELLEKRFG